MIDKILTIIIDFMYNDVNRIPRKLWIFRECY